MIAPAFMTKGALTVLQNVAAGRSPWHGWDANHPARTSEGQEAYEARARAITACRDSGLLTAENLLTAEGRQVLKSQEARHV